MQPFSCQHREQYILRSNYEITVLPLLRRFIFLRLELQIWSLGILELKLTNSCNSCNPNLVKTYEFSGYLIPSMKTENPFLETFTPQNQICIFQELLCVSNMDFIFYTDQGQNYSAGLYTFSRLFVQDVLYSMWVILHSQRRGYVAWPLPPYM